MKQRIQNILAIALLAVFICPAVSRAQEEHKDEMGLTRLKAVYPEDGATIADAAPMISVDASALESPMDSQTVTLTLNGTDVTGNAEVTPAYVVYTPPEPLPDGQYEVRVTAQDMNKKAIEPLAWIFIIKTTAGTQAGTETPGQPLKKDNTSGRLAIAPDIVSAKYIPQSNVDVTELFREKEGTKLNVDFSFANTSAGRTLLGAYHRETQSYTDIELDAGRLNYYDSNFSAAMGDFWFSLSDLTVLGTQMNGLRLDKNYGPWAMTFFAGRTQNPSTSGTFKQHTTGLHGAFAWDDKNTTSFTMLHARETNNLYFSESQSVSGFGVIAGPAWDNIAGLMHEYKFSDDISAGFETARAVRGSSATPAAHDGASRLFFNGTYKELFGEAELYTIDKNFFPIAEGSARYLKNDRDGFRLKGRYHPITPITLGGEYERYETDSAGTRTTRGNAFVGVSIGALQSLTYTRGKLATRTTLTDTNGVSALVVVPPTSVLTETRISTAWQDIDYTFAGAVINTEIILFSINTAYKDKLSFSFGFSRGRTEDIIALTAVTNRNYSIGLNWNVIPFKLLWTNRYEHTRNSGDSSDNVESRVKSAVKYVFNETYSMDFGYERLSLNDKISPVYDYKQHIIRGGMEMRF